jgi:hypothetical protein
MDQSTLWNTADVVLGLFASLAPATRRKLEKSPLREECSLYQDVLTLNSSIDDALAKGLAESILKLSRLHDAFSSLAGACDLTAVLAHSVAEEREELFSLDAGASAARIYALYTVTLLQERKCGTVRMLGPVPGALTPDFVVENTAYGECKDLRVTTPEGIWKNLWSNLEKADKQLKAAQGRAPLPLTLACVDIPPSASPDLQTLANDASKELAPLLSSLPNIQIVLITVQEIKYDLPADTAEYPYRWIHVRNSCAAPLTVASEQYLKCVFPSGWYCLDPAGKITREGVVR